MPTTESASPTSVQSLFCGEADRNTIVMIMARQLPSEGLAAGRIRHRFLTRATYRLLDSRILEVAARALDQDVGKSLAEWLATYQNLREVAARTADLSEDEEVATLMDPYPFSSTQRSQVSLYMHDKEVATIGFHLDLEVALGGISVAVRRAAIEELRCSIVKASATFTLDDYPKPLWQPEPVAPPDVRMIIQPPVKVPYVPTPRPEETSGPQRTMQRPPVPPGKAPALPTQ